MINNACLYNEPVTGHMTLQSHDMAPYGLILVLVIQSFIIYSRCDTVDDSDSTEILQALDVEKNAVKDARSAKKDWVDVLLNPENGLYPSTSAALMTQFTSSDKSSEEQLEGLKEMARKITEAIECEMTNLLSYALANCEKDGKHGTKQKRSVETPMDSSQLVLRLLKHIKSNNEYQNIAIEKMMTAQEIADKYGVEYNPSEDLLADLAAYSSQQSEQLTSIMNDAYGTSAKNEVQYVPLRDNEDDKEKADNSTYYVYAMHVPEEEIQSQLNSYPSYEYMPEQFQYAAPASPARYGAPHPHHSHYNFPETQISAPPARHVASPAYPRPVVREPAFTPTQGYYPPCGTMEPVTTTTTIVLPFEEPVQPEPELAGQVYEETISNKVFLEKGEEPGSTDLNHVMTYTVSEKSHFVTPQIEKLPQQMQYYFYMMN